MITQDILKEFEETVNKRIAVLTGDLHTRLKERYDEASLSEMIKNHFQKNAEHFQLEIAYPWPFKGNKTDSGMTYNFLKVNKTFQEMVEKHFKPLLDEKDFKCVIDFKNDRIVVDIEYLKWVTYPFYISKY